MSFRDADVIIHAKSFLQKFSSDLSEKINLWETDCRKEKSILLSKNELKGLDKNLVSVLIGFSSKFVSRFVEHIRNGEDTFTRIFDLFSSLFLIDFASWTSQTIIALTTHCFVPPPVTTNGGPREGEHRDQFAGFLIHIWISQSIRA